MLQCHFFPWYRFRSYWYQFGNNSNSLWRSVSRCVCAQRGQRVSLWLCSKLRCGPVWTADLICLQASWCSGPIRAQCVQPNWLWRALHLFWRPVQPAAIKANTVWVTSECYWINIEFSLLFIFFYIMSQKYFILTWIFNCLTVYHHCSEAVFSLPVLLQILFVLRTFT